MKHPITVFGKTSFLCTDIIRKYQKDKSVKRKIVKFASISVEFVCM